MSYCQNWVASNGSGWSVEGHFLVRRITHGVADIADREAVKPGEEARLACLINVSASGRTELVGAVYGISAMCGAEAWLNIAWDLREAIWEESCSLRLWYGTGRHASVGRLIFKQH